MNTMSRADTGNIPQRGQPSSKPPVTPRARRQDGFARLPLNRLIVPLVESVRVGLICIVAPPGGGKTTALRYLRAVLSAHPDIHLFDEDQQARAEDVARSHRAILACKCFVNTAIETFELCPWTLDDCMEYLAGLHRPQVASVLDRLAKDESVELIKGSPDLLSFVIDEMAANPSLATARQTLREFIEHLALPPPLQKEFAELCFERLGIAAPEPSTAPTSPRDLESLRWFRHEVVQRVFLGQFIARQLARREVPACLENMTAQLLLSEIASAVGDHAGAIDTLDHLVATDPRSPAVPMAASVLVKVNPAWRPSSKAALNLSSAVLRGARWAGIDLRYANLFLADLTGADLSGADLSKVDAQGVRLERANLRGARLAKGKFAHGKLAGADLSNAVASSASLRSADFTGAILTSADLSDGFLHEANFTGATLHWARLCTASLQKSELKGADFRGADLTEARLTHVAMYPAQWDQVRFVDARILECNLEGLELHGADFTRANLTGSLFTGSCFPGAVFRQATLVEAGLADIDWEGADLRDADLTHASFHLGSARSGLVGSTIPCEGSKTGFYTDDYNEQDYKCPEEIRKACLVGTDLRGARLEGTDFYLVDVRDAKYTEDQQRHFIQCGAILESRMI